MDRDRAQSAVAEAVRHLERLLEQLVIAIAHDPLVLRVDGASTDAAARRRVADAYAAIDLQGQDEPNKSVVCLGVLGVSREMELLAREVNESKARLKSVCAPLQTVRTRIPNPHGSGTKALPLIRVILRAIQRSDLNLLAAYRRIPVLEAAPAKIVYTRTQTRSVYRKSVEEIAGLLLNTDSPVAAIDREKLRALPAAEKHVALVRDHYENVRANVTFAARENQPVIRRLIAAELPIMYPRDDRQAGPEIKFPEPEDPASPKSRRTRRSKLAERPFLASVPAYRYLEPGEKARR